MAEDIEKVVNDAASNVACETGGVDNETLQKIKEQLMGMSNKSDDSFIYGLVKSATSEGEKGNGKSK